jgi:hypothetical protein
MTWALSVSHLRVCEPRAGQPDVDGALYTPSAAVAHFAMRKRATILCSPNFGYRHYLKALDDRPTEGLDLICSPDI